MPGKDVNDYPFRSGDGYEVANWLNDKKPGDRRYNDSRLATEAYRLMREAGWKFSTYSDWGQEIWRKPKGANHEPQ